AAPPQSVGLLLAFPRDPARAAVGHLAVLLLDVVTGDEEAVQVALVAHPSYGGSGRAPGRGGEVLLALPGARQHVELLVMLVWFRHLVHGVLPSHGSGSMPPLAEASPTSLGSVLSRP